MPSILIPGFIVVPAAAPPVTDPYAAYETRWCDFTQATTGGDGTETGKWGREELMDNIVAGQRGLCQGTGTINLTNRGIDFRPTLELTNSGISDDNRIILQMDPDNPFIINGGPTNSLSPALGGYTQNYYTIDGFEITGGMQKGIGLRNGTGLTARNCYIYGMRNNLTTDNCEGIRIENSTDILVENNDIDDIGAGGISANRSGIKNYNSTNFIARYNKITTDLGTVGVAIYDKEPGAGTLIYRNFAKGTTYTLANGYHHGGQGTNTTNPSVRIYENLGINISSAFVDHHNYIAGYPLDLQIYNNTFYGAAAAMYSHGLYLSDMQVYDNIIFPTSNPVYADIFLRNSSYPNISNWDYNGYRSAASMNINYVAYTLAQWQALGFDVNATLAASPLFKNAANDDYRLQRIADGDASDSPFISAGYAGGELGCYANEDWRSLVGRYAR